MHIYLGQLCSGMPADGCRYWTYFPKQKRTCFLLNSCDMKIEKGQVLSGKSSCDPLDFMKGLGKTISINIAALKEAKRAIEALTEGRKLIPRAAVTSCNEFVAFIEQRESS